MQVHKDDDDNQMLQIRSNQFYYSSVYEIDYKVNMIRKSYRPIYANICNEKIL